MLNAFTYMFKDKKIFSKIIVYAILVVFAYALLILLKMFGENNIYIGILLCTTTVFLFLSMAGYLISCIQSNMNNKEDVNLPYINPIKDLKKGFKKTVGLLILAVLICIASLFLFIPGAIIPYIAFIMFLFGLFPAFYYIFAKTEKVFSFVMFKKAIDIIRDNDKRYVIATLILIFVLILMATAHTVEILKMSEFLVAKVIIVYDAPPKEVNIISIVIYSVFYVILYAYLNFVSAYLFANCSETDI